jgi:hypothetical protein
VAHLVKKGDKLVYYPEYYKIRGPVLLDPELSPMENAWRVVDICASVWLNAFHVWSDLKEDMEDLEMSARLATMKELIRRVKQGTYDRSVSFYLNVRSCAFSKMQHAIIEPWVKHIKERDSLLDGNAPASLTKCDEDFTLYDVMSAKPMHRWFTEAERRYQGKDWWEFEREGDRLRVLQKQIDTEYEDYCSDCLEFGVDPITKENFIKNDNYTEDELKLLFTPPDKRNAYQRDYWKRRALLDPTWSEKRRQYNKTYYEKTKKKKV